MPCRKVREESGGPEAICPGAGLPPVVGDAPRTLILGSYPSVLSLKKGEYYGNPQNHFWRIIENLFSIKRDLPYEERTRQLKEHDIALWDVVRSCLRQGSADDRIRDPVFNDIPLFLETYPAVRLIVLNGQSAGQYFKELSESARLRPDIRTVILPSTSPANTRYPVAEKVRLWRIICPEDG